MASFAARRAIRKRYENYAKILLARKTSVGYHAAHTLTLEDSTDDSEIRFPARASGKASIEFYEKPAA
jgi:hypothetical protein